MKHIVQEMDFLSSNSACLCCLKATLIWKSYLISYMYKIYTNTRIISIYNGYQITTTTIYLKEWLEMLYELINIKLLRQLCVIE